MSRLVVVLLLSLATFGAAARPEATIYPYADRNTPVTVYGVNGSIDSFYGIPFAQPPTGNLRFRPPLALNGGAAVCNNTDYKPACMQVNAAFSGAQSEDCLYLNVFRPLGSEDAALPVFVFLYGGSFETGSAQADNFTSLVIRSVDTGMPIVVVTPNYRLGPFGGGYGQAYLENNATNLQLQDVRMALDWVHGHIDAFGGDPDKITLGGASAGAVAASLMPLISDGPDYLAGVFLNSGSPAANPLAPTVDGFPRVYPLLVEYSGCSGSADTFACLQTVNATVLNDAAVRIVSSRNFSTGFPFNPNVDYRILPDRPSVLLDSGRFTRVPTMAGDDRDEGTEFVEENTNTTQQVREQVKWLEPVNPPAELLDELLELYPNDAAEGSPFHTGDDTFGLNSQFKRISALYGDLCFQHARRYLLQKLNECGWSETWTWLFAGPPPAGSPAYLGIPHVADGSFFYAETAASPSGPAELSLTMSTYLLNFIYYQNPNGMGSNSTPYWPRYADGNSSANMQHFKADNTSYSVRVIQDNYRAEKMRFINAHAAAFDS